MVLVYLSAARTCNKLENGSYVQAEIIHNEKTFIRTELMKSVTEDEAKLLMTQKLLAEIPWTTEAVTVFWGNEEMGRDAEMANAGKWGQVHHYEEWREIFELQKRFALFVSHRSKGVLSDYLNLNFNRTLAKGNDLLIEAGKVVS